MCIYYGNREDLHYETQEHVIPAGLGCSTKLAKGIVSDEANTFFSPIERNVLKKSLIQIPRVIQGPGKRGSLSHKKATTSAIVAVKYGEENLLGYMKGKKGYLVSQLVINDDKISFLCQQDTKKYIDCESEIDLIKEKMLYSDKYVPVLMPEGCREIFVAVFKGKLYIGCSHELKKEEYVSIKELFNSRFGIRSKRKNENIVSMTIPIEHNQKNVYKIVIKTIINTYAYLTSEKDVLNCDELTKLKEYIFSEDYTILKRVDEIGYSETKKLKKKLFLLNDEHACIIFQQNDVCKAIVFFYNYGFLVEIGKIKEKNMSHILMNGIVVNWKKHIDYEYCDFIHLSSNIL